jgi:hypothetical protein
LDNEREITLEHLIEAGMSEARARQVIRDTVSEEKLAAPLNRR